MADLTAADPRLEAYCRLLVERSLRVQPGWQVVIRSTPLARPALEELARQIARAGAYAIPRVGWTMWPDNHAWAETAPEGLLGEMAPIDRFTCDAMDARITMAAPENTREGSHLGHERLRLANQASRYFFRRSMADEIPWVSTIFPTQALAQEAGMTLRRFEDFFYDACLVDWDAVGERIRGYADVFDAASEVRIVGPGTDLRLSIEGRSAALDRGITNMPGGEFFYAPVEESAEGVIHFAEFPAVFEGEEFLGIRLELREGRVVDATAKAGEARLQAILDRDEGSRRIGELGIGCNPGITRFTKSVLFDEKIAGTIHLALGQSYAKCGGLNQSSIHWDIVKDLRTDGRIEVDGRTVQSDGSWLI